MRSDNGARRASDDVCCAGRLAQDPRHFFEDRTGSVGAIERLIAAPLALQQPRSRETIQLADHCPRWQPNTPRDLASMQRLIRREQQKTQHTAPVSGEKNGCEGLLHNSQRLSPFLQQAGKRLKPGRSAPRAHRA
jgi:hypothetical protein